MQGPVVVHLDNYYWSTASSGCIQKIMEQGNQLLDW